MNRFHASAGMFAAIIGVLALAFAVEAQAGPRHRRDAVDGQPRPYQFYPEEVENGVRGNLPFNNQMRKFSDPLNANGAGG